MKDTTAIPMNLFFVAACSAAAALAAAAGKEWVAALNVVAVLVNAANLLARWGWRDA